MVTLNASKVMGMIARNQCHAIDRANDKARSYGSVVRHAPKLPVDHLIKERGIPEPKIKIITPKREGVSWLRTKLLADMDIKAKAAPCKSLLSQPKAPGTFKVSEGVAEKPFAKPAKPLREQIRDMHRVVSRNEFYIEHGHRPNVPCCAGNCDVLDYPNS
jgi:hypothetical protein